MPCASVHPRHAEPRLAEALADSPAVLIHGPRQCGKTTLARVFGEQQGYVYISFDDEVTRLAAVADPAGFIADQPAKIILDEVQRVPSIFNALKMAIDRDRSPGRFLLTGSSHAMLVPKLADSLAGRMEVLQLHPLSQAELEHATPRFLDRLFAGRFPSRSTARLGDELAQRICAGGFPPALARDTDRRRANWHANYIASLVQRDLRDFTRINSLETLPRLLALAAAQTARLLNVAELASAFRLSRPTVGSYMTLLESVFLLERLPPWHNNAVSRLIKTPKLHFVDTGLACAVLRADADALRADRMLLGLLLETFVFQELKRQASGHEHLHNFCHFRDKDGTEVDIVVERGLHDVAGVEVKAGATVRTDDFRGLRKLKRTVGDRFAGGVVLYDGETCAGFGDGLYAVPVRMLWERPPPDAGGAVGGG